MIVAGARVRVAIPRNQPCSLHCVESVPVLGAIGTVDRVDERLDEHCVVVVFDLWHLGTQWTDRFRPSELVPLCQPLTEGDDMVTVASPQLGKG